MSVYAKVDSIMKKVGTVLRVYYNKESSTITGDLSLFEAVDYNAIMVKLKLINTGFSADYIELVKY